MKTKKTLIAVCSVLALLAVFATASFFAIFANRERTDASINTGVIDVKLVETFDGYTKVVNGKNEGTQPAYVRVRIFNSIEVQQEDETWAVHGGIPISAIKYQSENISPPDPNGDWIDGNDGYLYYKYILNPGDETTKFTIKEMKINLEGDLEKYSNDTLRVNMLVSMESCQASNELYKLNWNIDKLPPQVEQ